MIRCKHRKGGKELSTPLCNEVHGLQPVELYDGVRRVAIKHLFSNKCKVEKEEKHVKHSQSLLAGGLREVQGR